ncbi:glycerol-3-phosphate dehydrogenase, partial [Trifolium medium]|nr:glycerol-3-phosphate dehydrogenase [Trifolium medium]
FNSMEDMWKLCDLNWSSQCKITITVAIINLINTLWLVRNQARFNNKLIPWRSAISLIIANTALTGNNTSKSSSNSIRDFTFLKMFRIAIHHPKTPVLREIFWQPPLLNWIKCNIDGASSGNPVNASCGGVFRDHNAEFVYAFAEPLGVAYSYFAELCGAMRAIEIAYEKNWEGNKVADLIANHGLTLSSFISWNIAPLFITDCMYSNKLGMPSFRLCSS